MFDVKSQGLMGVKALDFRHFSGFGRFERVE